MTYLLILLLYIRQLLLINNKLKTDKQMKHFYKLLAMTAIISIIFSGCSKDDPIIDEDELPSQTVTSIEGLYLLNQGNMNTNKASLDYYDYSSGVYRKDIFSEANPDAVMGLGDVGNDLGVYGSKLYAVINNSNKIEILDVATAERKKVIDTHIDNPRYITFANGKAYVTAYGSSVNGFVAEIDTTTLEITKTVEVGRQPEELAVVDGKLYVANSGWVSAPEYETTVSVIDLNSFKVIDKIEVAPNLQRVKADKYGNLYVSSQGDFDEIPSNLFVIDTKKGEIKKSLDIPTSNLTIVGDTAYVISSVFSMDTYKYDLGYHLIDIKKEEVLDDSFLQESVKKDIEMPYSIAVDPITRNIYITDARDFASPGTLYCIDKEGAEKFTRVTGDIPASIAFRYSTKTIEN